jgi:hypothetical protein
MKCGVLVMNTIIKKKDDSKDVFKDDECKDELIKVLT